MRLVFLLPLIDNFSLLVFGWFDDLRLIIACKCLLVKLHLLILLLLFLQSLSDGFMTSEPLVFYLVGLKCYLLILSSRLSSCFGVSLLNLRRNTKLSTFLIQRFQQVVRSETILASYFDLSFSRACTCNSIDFWLSTYYVLVSEIEVFNQFGVSIFG